MSLKFVKMHGLGNDFIVLDGVQHPIQLTPQEISQLSCRHTGIGFDQCLIVEKSHHQGIDFSYRIINADGQEVGQCGNGARCLARFIRHYGLSDKNRIKVATSTTHMMLEINQNDTVTVQMNTPRFDAKSIPTTASIKNDHLVFDDVDTPSLVYAVNVGNPHAVMVVEDIETAPVDTLGQTLCHHTDFPDQANIGFMEVLDNSHIKLRVYERGCGETQACGSGAVAAALIGMHYLKLNQNIQIDLPGGSLHVSWEGLGKEVYLTGTATFIYEGQLFDTYLQEGKT